MRKYTLTILLAILSFTAMAQVAFYDAQQLCKLKYKTFKKSVESTDSLINNTVFPNKAEIKEAWDANKKNRDIVLLLLDTDTRWAKWKDTINADFKIGCVAQVQEIIKIININELKNKIQHVEEAIVKEKRKLDKKTSTNLQYEINVNNQVDSLNISNIQYSLKSDEVPNILVGATEGDIYYNLDSLQELRSLLVDALRHADTKDVVEKVNTLKATTNNEIKVLLDKITNVSSSSDGTDGSSSSFGIPSQSQIIWATADFLADRFKQEVNSAFIKQMQNQLNKLGPAKYFFKETIAVLNFDQFVNYQTLGITFKSAILKDLNNMPESLLLSLEDSTLPYKNLIPEENLHYMRQVVHMMVEIRKGSSLDNIIEDYGQKYTEFKTYNTDLTIQYLYLFSNNLRSQSEDKTWVSAEELKRAIRSDINFMQFFMAHLYHQHTALFDSTKLGFTVADLRESKTLKEFESKVNLIATQFNTVQGCINVIKTKIDKNDKFTAADYAAYLKTMNNVILAAAELVNVKNEGKNDVLKNLPRYLSIGTQVISCYEAAEKQEYGTLINNIIHIIDTLVNLTHSEQYASLNPASRNVTRYYEQKARIAKLESLLSKETREQDSLWIKKQIDKFKSDNANLSRRILIHKRTSAINYTTALGKIAQYSMFISDVLTAKNDKQLRKVIESYALPAGSSSIKRNSLFTISLNAYVGGFAGNEWLKVRQRSDGNIGWDGKPSLAFTAPIGVDFSWGLRTKKFGNEAGSIGIFLAAFDLGALVSFRLQDNATSDLPKVAFQNILAPGAYIVYGFPKVPLSIAAGVQRSPALRKVTASTIELKDEAGVRAGVSLFVDIPMYNFFNRRFAKQELTSNKKRFYRATHF